MQRTTMVAISLTVLAGLGMWHQHHLVVTKAAPLILPVINTADSGPGSLRQAIADANAASGPDTITFDAGVFATPKAITLTSGALSISDALTVTGPGVSLLTISGNSNSRVFSIESGNYDVTLSGLTLINGRHTAPGGGGGIQNLSSGTLTLVSSVLSGNTASGLGSLRGTGGGILNAGSGALVVINSTLSDNFAYGLASGELAYGQGGGIFNAGNGTITLTNAVLSGNTANGAVFAFGFGFGEGGGIFNAGNGTVTLTSTTLSGNSAKSSALPGRGGGIFNASIGTVHLINSTLSDNTTIGSQGLGGGIANTAGVLTLTNSTLSGNSCTGGGIGQGGGIYQSGNGSVALINSTLSGNSVNGEIQSEGGGLFREGAGPVNIRNSLIAGNSAMIMAPDVRGTVNSQGHNLIGDGTDSSGFTGTGDQVGTSNAPINAKLAPLANNGGPTTTRALLAGSPAIDSGDNCVVDNPGCLATPVSTDQRGAGFVRKSGGAVDIGAFEVQPAPTEYKGDVAPRPFGNGSLSLADWVQNGRFAAGLDTPTAGSEFQRADCAPRATGGNGVVSVADWVQAGRYGANLDPPTPVGGPIAFTSSLAEAFSLVESRSPSRRDTRRGSVVVVTSTASRGPGASVVVWLESRGIENAMSLSVSFDPSQWQFVDARPERDAFGATLVMNDLQIKTGKIGFAVALPPGQTVATGWRSIVEIRLRPVEQGAKELPRIETIEDGPVSQEVVDVNGNPIRLDWRSSVRR